MDNMLITKDEARTILVALEQNFLDWGEDMSESEVEKNEYVMNLIKERWPDIA